MTDHLASEARNGDNGQPHDDARPIRRRAAAQVILLGAFGLDLLLYSLVVPFLPAEAQRLGATPLMTGVLFAMYAVGLFVATPFAALLTDRAGPRRTLLWGLVVLAGSTLAFAFAPDLSLGLAGLFVARAAQGAASAVTWTAGLAILAQLYSAADRPRIFARAFTVTGLAALIGPPLGGALYSLGGYTLPFLVATGLALLDGAGRLLFLPDNASLPATRPQPGALRLLLGDSRFLVGLFAAMLGALALSALEPVTPLLLGESYELPTWGIGAAFGVLALCFVFMQPAVSHSERRRGAGRTIRNGLISCAVCFAGITGASALGTRAEVVAILTDRFALYAVLALLVLIGCSLAFVLIPAPELLTKSGERLAGSSGAPYGAIYGAYNGAYALGTLIGPLAAGGAVTARGIENGYLLLAIAPAFGALVLIAGSISMPWWPRRHKRDASETSETPETPVMTTATTEAAEAAETTATTITTTETPDMPDMAKSSEAAEATETTDAVSAVSANDTADASSETPETPETPEPAQLAELETDAPPSPNAAEDSPLASLEDVAASSSEDASANTPDTLSADSSEVSSDVPSTDSPVDVAAGAPIISFSGGSAESDARYLANLLAVGGADARAYKDLSYQLLALQEGQHVLDVGCGIGVDLPYLSKLVGPAGAVVGLDRNAELVERASQYIQDDGIEHNTRAITGAAEQIPLPDASFDRARTDRAMQHFDNPAAALAEIWRVLKPGGIVSLVEPDWGMMALDPGSAQGGDDDSSFSRVMTTMRESLAHPLMGRQLHGLLRAMGEQAWERLQVQIVTFGLTSWEMVDPILEVTKTVQVIEHDDPAAHDELEGWLAAVQQAAAEGRFFAAIPLFFATAWKAQG